MFFAISLVMILADNICFPFVSNQVSSHANYPGVSDQFETQHSHGIEDNIIILDLKTKTIQCSPVFSLFLSNHLNFTDDYTSNIWQPPKYS